MTDPSNPFDTAEPWFASGGVLPPGDYVVTISEAEGGSTSNGNPQIELKFDCDAGSIKQWLNYNQKSLGKVVGLFLAAGIERPQPGEFDPDSFRLTQGCIDRLLTKEIGIVVRHEPDYKGEVDPATGQVRLRSRVKGYSLPSEISSDAPIDTRGLPEPGASESAPPASNPKIPF